MAADISAENRCWDLLSSEQTVRAMHICRGSRTSVRGTGGYEWLAEHLFDQLHVDRFLLEYDSELVGGFEPLRFLPKGKTVVLCLISPQCGFGGSADNAFMTPEEQWRKLELVVCVAERVWGSVAATV